MTGFEGRSNDLADESGWTPPAIEAILGSSNAYGALGVSSQAGESEISDAFRGLSTILHPDITKAGDDDPQTKAYKKVTEAYAALKNGSSTQGSSRSKQRNGSGNRSYTSPPSYGQQRGETGFEPGTRRRKDKAKIFLWSTKIYSCSSINDLRAIKRGFSNVDFYGQVGAGEVEEKFDGRFTSIWITRIYRCSSIEDLRSMRSEFLRDDFYDPAGADDVEMRFHEKEKDLMKTSHGPGRQGGGPREDAKEDEAKVSEWSQWIDEAVDFADISSLQTKLHSARFYTDSSRGSVMSKLELAHESLWTIAIGEAASLGDIKLLQVKLHSTRFYTAGVRRMVELAISRRSSEISL